MHSQLISKRLRNTSLSAVPPPQSSNEYQVHFAEIAAHILYRSPLPSQSDTPVYVINAAAFPDIRHVDYDALLPYVLARLPDENQLIDGKGFEVIFFAGGEERNSKSTKKGRPGYGRLLQTYHVLSRTMRKRLQKLYVVHEKRGIRVMIETFSTVVSPKFRKKIVHVSTLSALALYVPIEDLLIPPSTYSYDRRLAQGIHVPYATGRRAFGTDFPLPTSSAGSPRLPRVLRETTSFILTDHNVRSEGLFRVNARAVDVGVLREAYDRGQKFIIWREGESVLTFSHWKEGHGNVMVEELSSAEGFGVNTAASLIKLWYAELREPIFPQTAYAYVERICGSLGSFDSISTILDLIAEFSEWSPISKTSRQILTMHLLPLLSLVAENQDWNQMNAHNLAVCIAPALLRGPDALEDTQMIGMVSQILEYAVKNWKSQLSVICGMNQHKFEETLRVPEAASDQEDPLDATSTPLMHDTQQTAGIVLIDNEGSDDDEEEEEDRPPLPPRLILATSEPNTDGGNAPRRKPAPSLQAPPRYSTIISAGPDDLDHLPLYSLTVNERLIASSESEQYPATGSPTRTDTIVPRKPLPNLASRS